MNMENKGDSKGIVYIATSHYPILDNNVSGVPAIETIGVHRAPLGT
jgi:hypothetical protein